MIPKLASHLLQLKSQGTHHIRNVIQTSGSTSSTSISWSGIGSSSSSWGGSTGAGGAKFNAGSRFYAGYTGPGRVITQATSVSGSDGSNGQPDDSEENNQSLRANGLSTHVTRIRPRRNSFSVGAPRLPVPESPTSQQSSSIHTQVRGAFSTDDSSADSPFATVSPASPAPRASRRNSTSAVERPPSTLDSDAVSLSPESGTSVLLTDADTAPQVAEAYSLSKTIDAVETIPTQQEPEVSVAAESQLDSSSDISEWQSLPSSISMTGPESPVSVDSAHVQPLTNVDLKDLKTESVANHRINATATEEALEAALTSTDRECYEAIQTARLSGSFSNVVREIRKMRSAPFPPNLMLYNLALHAINVVRTKGTPIALSLELYNEMVARNLVPNSRTYENVIRALCERDEDIQDLINARAKPSAITKEKALFGRPTDAEDTEATELISKLKEEPNFRIAMTLFTAAKNAQCAVFPTDTYNLLLRSAAYRGDVDAALKIYAQLEARKDILPNMATFGHLLSVYAEARDLEGAREIFKEFQDSARSGRLSSEYRKPGLSHKQYQALVKHGQGAANLYMRVYNKMISVYFKCGEPAGALSLLEEMMKAENTDPGLGDIPSPSASTYTTIIVGFCEAGDLDSAVIWFERLLTHKAVARDGFAAMDVPLRPDRGAWTAISTALASAGKLEILNKLFEGLIAPLPDASFQLSADDVHKHLAANMSFLLSEQAAKDISKSSALIQFLQDNHNKCVVLASLSVSQDFAYLWLLARARALIGQTDEALLLAHSIVERENIEIQKEESTSALRMFYKHGLQRSLLELADDIMGTTGARYHVARHASLEQAFRLFEEIRTAGANGSPVLWAALVRLYIEQKRANDGVMFMVGQPKGSWLSLIWAFRCLQKIMGSNSSDAAVAHNTLDAVFDDSTPYTGLQSLLTDIAAARELDADLKLSLQPADLFPVYGDLTTLYGFEGAKEVFLALGEFGQEAMLAGLDRAMQVEVLNDPIADSFTSDPANKLLASSSPAADMRIDFKLSTRIETALNPQTGAGAEPRTLQRDVMEAASQGRYITSGSLAKLISAVGRVGTIDEVRALYGIAQRVLASMANDLDAQTQAWFVIEDSMITAHAFTGDIESANLHRTRILDQGGRPSAEAYAVLIMKVHDYTDDCSVAMAYYNEARSLGIVPTTFLYNNIISKLARARKAETALAIFHEMRQSRVWPTSVTYGALIGACCRVGDADSAQYLFNEMASQNNFKPKAPPFNTMIQFFVHTKPDREKALYYHKLMVSARVKPTAHTFKLLMDLYGTIEPINMGMVQKTFDELARRSDMKVQGVHWASLITAWGCSCKDVDRAEAIFDSISHHPTTLASGAKLPDAPAWEALINVLVTQHRFDQLPVALQRLQDSDIHMTAYIANVIIRGYAAAGAIERARAVFESLQDPPSGLAAVYNHASSAGTDEDVAPDAPVYREPSTWETMVRAEMGVGERSRAEELLLRMEARHFPPAVETRIRSLVGQASSMSEVPNMFNLQNWDAVNQLPAAVVAPAASLISAA